MNTERPAKKNLRFKRLAIGFAVFTLLGVVAYVALTSSFVVKRVLLPRIGQMMNAELSAQTVSVNPWRELRLGKVKLVTTPQGAPLFEVEEVRLRHDLLKIMTGDLEIESLVVSKPQVFLENRSDGSSNLDPILRALESKGTKESDSGSEKVKGKVNVRSVSMVDGGFRWSKQDTTNKFDIRMDGIELLVDGFGNGQTTKARVRTKYSSTKSSANVQQTELSRTTGKVEIDSELTLGTMLELQKLATSGKFEVLEAVGESKELGGLNLNFRFGLSSNAMDYGSIELVKSGRLIAQANGNGALDLNQKSGRLKLNAGPITKNLLAMFPGDGGTEFGDTSIAWKGEIDFDLKEGRWGIRNEILGKKVSMRKSTVALPPMDWSWADRLKFDSKSSRLSIESIQFSYQPVGGEPYAGNVEGEMVFWGASKLSGRIRVSSSFLDLTPFMRDELDKARTDGGIALGKGKEARDLIPRVDPADLGRDKSPKSATSAFQIPEIVFGIRVDRIKVKALEVTKLVIHGDTGAKGVNVDTVEMRLNEVPVVGNLRVEDLENTQKFATKVRIVESSIEPLVDAFASEYRSQANGRVLGDLSLVGQMAGPNGVMKSMSGAVRLSLTNANVNLVGPRARTILTPIASILRIPEILKSPLDGMDVQCELGDEQIRIKEAMVRTPAFQARASGSIAMQEEITNSTLNLPVVISLKQSIARKANLLRSDAASNSDYVPLPVFATLKGTLGAPETKTDALVLAGLGLKTVVGIPGVVTGKAGNLVQGIGNLLSGGGGNQDGDGSKKEDPTSKQEGLNILKLIPNKKTQKNE